MADAFASGVEGVLAQGLHQGGELNSLFGPPTMTAERLCLDLLVLTVGLLLFV